MNDPTIQALITLWQEYKIWLKSNGPAVTNSPQSFGAFMDWLVAQNEPNNS